MSNHHYHYGYAEKYHRHYDDDESTAEGLREDLGHAEARIRELEEQLASEVRKLWDHISNMPGGV